MQIWIFFVIFRIVYSFKHFEPSMRDNFSLPARKLTSNRLHRLIKSNLSLHESPGTQKIIKKLNGVKRKSFFAKRELILVCNWKSPRVIHQIMRNRPDTVIKITGRAFAAPNEEGKMKILITLHGVGIPMASAMLMLSYPNSYGVIDIRVWKLLYEAGIVKTNANGTGFTVNRWIEYLSVLRCFAGQYGVNTRDIERTLFEIHKQYQRGNLYNNYNGGIQTHEST